MVITAQEFCKQSHQLDELHRYELHDGQIVRSPLDSMQVSKIGIRIGSLIARYLLENDIGHLTGTDGAYSLSPYDVLVPHVGFIRYERLQHDIDGFVPQAPNLAVEVLSPYDSKPQTQQKAQKYLALGTQLVWIVYPKTDKVDICKLDANGQTEITEKGIDDTLSGESVLPGFVLPVKDIFAVKKSE